jgi:hypothetical protein
MTHTTNNAFARIAAVVAGVGLVAASMGAFVPAHAQTASPSQIAALQAQINALLAQLAALQGTSASVTFTRDLTIGSTGADVTALQNWLISKGYSIPAGATGYFGAQTQAALARYQAANAITPAAGYFGPITRTHINSMGTPVPPTPDDDDDNDGELEGGEADLSDFELRREESTGNEGEGEVEVFTAEFDVEDGDVRVERMEIMASATDDDMSQDPWDYFDRVVLFDAEGDEIADMDVDDRDAWDEEGDEEYVLDLTGLDYVVREGDRAEITVAFDIADTIDSDDLGQDFVFWIEDDGIRATDAEGIQQYIGDDSETVTFGFGEEETGDLTIRSSDEDPDSSILVSDEDDESEEFSVFAFEIENEEDVDTLLTDLTIDVTTGSGDADDYLRRATLVLDGDEFDGDIGASSIEFEDLDFELAGDEMVTAELMVTLVRNAANTSISFDVDAADLEAEGLDSGDESEVGGGASSETHTIGRTGTAVEGISTSQMVVTPGSSASATYGSYTIRFEVTALEDDAFIEATADTSGTVGVTYDINGSTFTAEAQSAVLTSSADRQGNFYRVDEGDTETFTLTVTLNPADAGTFSVELDTIRFNDEASFTDSIVFDVDSGNPDFETDPIYIAD